MFFWFLLPYQKKKIIILLKKKYVLDNSTLYTAKYNLGFIKWSHHSDFSTDSKVVASLKDPIVHVGCIYSGTPLHVCCWFCLIK